MARVVIEIDGDASGAEAALEEVQESLGGLDEASESAGSSFGGLNTKLVNAASAVGIAKAGFELLRGGINMLWGATERYFTATEDGQAMWEDLERQAGELKNMLFELFIGTSDQTEAFARMSAIMGDLVSVGHAVVGVVSPLVNLIRSGVGFTMNFASALMGVDREARAAARGLDGLQGEIGEAERRMEAFRAAFENVAGVETIDNLAENMIGEVVEVSQAFEALEGTMFESLMETRATATAQAFETLAGRMFETLMESRAAEEGYLTASHAIFQFHQEISAASEMSWELRGRLREIANSVEGGRHVWNAASQAIVEHQNQQLAMAAALDETSRSSSRSGESTRDMGAASASAAMDVVALALAEGQLAEIIKYTNSKMSEQAALAATAEKQRLAAREGKMADIAAADEFEREMMLRREQLRQQLEDNEATRAARQQERVNLAKGGYQTLTTSAIGMVAAHIKAGKQSAEEIRKLIGSELVALGTMGLAKAAMMVFEPGKQALAAGLAVASIAAIGVGAKMGANASGGGGGVAAPASTSAPSVTNVTFQSNFAQIGSRDQFLRVTGDSFQEAVDEGYIALPRGN